VQATYEAWVQLVPPEDREAAEADVARVIDPVNPDDDYVSEYRVRHPDGSVRWLSAVGRAFFEPDPEAPEGRRVVHILGTVRDVTTLRQEEAARREREERDRYLLELEERLRTAGTARATAAAACETLGRTLNVALVGVGDVEPDGQHTVVESEWRAGPTPTTIGRHRLVGSGAARVAPLRQGLALIMPDVTTAPVTANEPAAQAVYAGLGIRALIDVPLMREGRPRAILYVADTVPRAWTQMDAALARETLERTWHATERARAERALADSEDRLRLALEAGEMGIWDWDLPTDRLLWDKRQSALFGLDLADGMPQGQEALARVHPDDRPGLEGAISQALLPGNGVFHHEFRVCLPSGAVRWIGGCGHAIRDQDGRAVRLVGLNFDITQQKDAAAVLARDKAELERLVEERTAALRDSEVRLAQAAKMEALGRLAGGVAHDFNNVLQAVQGGIALAAKRLTEESRPAARFLTIAAEAAERGAAVTGRLLAFARRGDLTAAPVEPAHLLEELAQLLRHTLGPSVVLEVAPGPGTPVLLADVGQLEAVLVNLANNARDALPGGCGTIILGAEPVTVRAGVPAVPNSLASNSLAPGNYVRLSVADNGEGIPPELLARVTEPFFTTKPKGKGTGLGLAMAHGFAGQSGGALTIESAPGQGTTVSLWLPQARPGETGGAETQGQKPPQAALPDRPGWAVLLVDDEHGVRTVIATALADRGHTVAEAADAAAALARLDAGIAIDALVTDLAMPGGMDGLALIREVRRRRPNLPAVLITGHAGEAAQDGLREVAETGPFAMLRKPASARVC
jgi:PAS domain S-box-containing protein